MAALEAGRKAPEILLPTTNGGKFSLAAALERGPVLAAFFKISCPVCQLAAPYLDKISKAYGNGRVTLVGVSQNSREDTLAFMKEFGVTFPVALDPESSYPASNAYGLTNVPSLFLIAPDGKIALSSVGWVKAEIDDVNARIARAAGKPKAAIFDGNSVPEWKAG
jgi:cytochrome c biogenesis protein CcmG/thiol:disulfide interchange protein DsbE